MMFAEISVLFGLQLAPLFDAIAAVESSRGATSENVYQIRPIYVRDLNRIYPECRWTMRDVRVKTEAEGMMALYWRHYGRIYRGKTDCPVTYEVLARIHNGGPNGWRKAETLGYWRRVKKEMGGVK